LLLDSSEHLDPINVKIAELREALESIITEQKYLKARDARHRNSKLFFLTCNWNFCVFIYQTMYISLNLMDLLNFCNCSKWEHQKTCRILYTNGIYFIRYYKYIASGIHSSSLQQIICLQSGVGFIYAIYNIIFDTMYHGINHIFRSFPLIILLLIFVSFPNMINFWIWVLVAN
jgi:hypothetical protein